MFFQSTFLRWFFFCSCFVFLVIGNLPLMLHRDLIRLSILACYLAIACAPRRASGVSNVLPMTSWKAAVAIRRGENNVEMGGGCGELTEHVGLSFNNLPWFAIWVISKKNVWKRNVCLVRWVFSFLRVCVLYFGFAFKHSLLWGLSRGNDTLIRHTKILSCNSHQSERTNSVFKSSTCNPRGHWYGSIEGREREKLNWQSDITSVVGWYFYISLFNSPSLLLSPVSSPLSPMLC